MRCKVCLLPKEKRKSVEEMMFRKIPLRRISDALKQNGTPVSYAAISRHGHHVLWVKRKPPQIDSFLVSRRCFRPVSLSVNLDADVWRTLRRKRTLLSSQLKRTAYPGTATTSSVANYFLEKGVNAILGNSETADRVLRSFMKRRASFTNSRKKRTRARLATIMISRDLNKKLQVDVQLSVWLSKSIEQLYGLWGEPKEPWRRLPHPSLTDYANLALGVGLELEN